MRYLFVVVILLILHHTYSYPSESESPKKFKLSSEPGYFTPARRSNRRYEHQVGPPDQNVKKISSASDPNDDDSRHDHNDDDSRHDHNDDDSRHDHNDDDSRHEHDDVSRYEFYKPLKTYGPFGPNEDDSKYIPHGEAYSKYVTKNSQRTPDSKDEHDWKDHEHRYNEKDADKSEEVPRYGFVRQNHQSSRLKYHENEDDEDLSKKHHDDYLNKKHSYGLPSKENSGSYKEHEHDKKHSDTYSDDEKDYRYHHYPQPDTEHKHSHDTGKYTKQYYPESKEQRHPRYPEEKELEHHRYPEHEKYGYRNYPEHKENYDHHDHPDHEKGGHHHHYPDQKKEYGHHRYPDEKKEYGHHHYPEHEEKHEPHPYSEHKEEHEHEHYPEPKEKHEYHRYPEHSEENDKHPPRHQHYKPTRPLAIRHSLRLAEEIKSKIHSIPLRFKKFPTHHTRQEEKVSYVPKVTEIIEDHKINSHKLPHDKNGPHEVKHDHLDDSKKGHYLIKHQPHPDKNQPEHNYKPNYNVGGHSYGWEYEPKFDLYHQMQKDLDTKIRLLKEHDEKLAELQRNHLEKYRGLFKPHYAKNFLNHELPKHVIPDLDYKHHSHIPKHDEKKKAEDSDVEVYVKREPKEHHHHYHYDPHHPKHASKGKEPTHYHHDPHHYHEED